MRIEEGRIEPYNSIMQQKNFLRQRGHKAHSRNRFGAARNTLTIGGKDRFRLRICDPKRLPPGYRCTFIQFNALSSR